MAAHQAKSVNSEPWSPLQFFREPRVRCGQCGSATRRACSAVKVTALSLFGACVDALTPALGCGSIVRFQSDQTSFIVPQEHTEEKKKCFVFTLREACTGLLSWTFVYFVTRTAESMFTFEAYLRLYRLEKVVRLDDYSKVSQFFWFLFPLPFCGI